MNTIPTYSQQITPHTLEIFRCDIKNFDWTLILAEKGANDAYNKPTMNLTRMYQSAFPYKKTKNHKTPNHGLRQK